MRKLLLSLATLLCGASGWAEVLPTEQILASSNMPSMGTPENRFYVRQTKSGGAYWKSTTTGTINKSEAGKFAFYAVPGLENCYYIYSVDEQKWVNYTSSSENNTKDFASLSDNFNANAYWEITRSTLTGNPTVSCYQMRPTVNKVKDVSIKTDRYANWYQGSYDSNTIGLWQDAPTQDAGSAWSLETVTADNAILMAQEIAFAKSILETESFAITKGADMLTSENVTTVMSSPYTESNEGSIAGLVDGNANTFWHSKWSGGEQINGTHYIVADISSTGEVPELLSFTYTRRGGAANDHTSRWAIYGVPSDESGIADDSRNGLTLLAIVSTPMGSATTFENTFRTKGFSKFRFYCEASSSNRGYFHIGEFQLNGWTVAEGNSAELKALAEAIATAENVAEPTETDIEALKALTSPYTAGTEAIAEAQALLAKTGAGYPSETAEARANLAELLSTAGGKIHAAQLQALVAAYKASTDIALPEAGKAYRLAFVDYNGNEYKIVANGTTLSATAASEAETAASVFYCHKYTNVNGQERFALISPEAKFLGYNTLNDDYRTHVNADKRLQADFAIGSMVGNTSGNIESSKRDALFGTLYMTVDNRTLESQGANGCFVMKIANNAFDKSTAAFFNSNFTSAIKFTEVTDHAASNEVLVAASTIEPLINGYKVKDATGAGYGKYYYTMNGTIGYSFEDYEAAIKAETSVIGETYAVVYCMPTPGFYRIINNAGNACLVSGTGTGKLKFKNGEEANISSVFYYDGSKLVSYDNGLCVSKSGNFLGYTDNVGESTKIEFKSDPQLDGKCFVMFQNNSETECNRALHCVSVAEEGGSADGNAGNSVGVSSAAEYRFTIQPVELLPVPMDAAVGYTTIYSPVELGLGDKVEAYTAKANTTKNTVELVSQTAIPANTGVVLKYKAGSELVNGCVYLPVQGTTLTNVESDLAGSLADAYVTPETDQTCYVLAKPGTEVAFYPATLDGTDGTSFLNNGFSAYLPIATTTAPERFRLDFGTETGIGNIEATATEGNANAVIYDLSGRRVKNALKGIYIVNGKKVIK